MTRKRWKYRAGPRGSSVTVEEVPDSPNIYIRWWSRQKRTHVYRSLGHNDRALAIQKADEIAARLGAGLGPRMKERPVRLHELISAYLKYQTPSKADETQQADRRQAELFQRILGTNREAEAIGRSQLNDFVRKRSSGEIDARGCAVPESKRRPVGPRTVQVDLSWLKAVFNWGSGWMLENGKFLVSKNPLHGYPMPKELNPRRPTATVERFKAVRAVSDDVTMQVIQGRKKRSVRSYLSELLDIVNGTGRRINSVCKLAYADLLLHEGPYGSIRWRAEHDKIGRESVVPVGPDVRAAIDRILRERPGIGDAPLFPSPKLPDQPVRYELVSSWLLEAERLAGLPKLEGGLWHPYRRKWATERKHLPPVDVAAAGGWSNAVTLQVVYQKADPEGMLNVVTNPRPYRGATG